MDLTEAIKTRRSIGKVKDDPVSSDAIKKILEAGTYAPNHYRTEPWRFFVLIGDSRKKLGGVLEDIARLENVDLVPDEWNKKAEKARNNPLRAPVIIAVGVEPGDKKNVMIKEEYAAVCSAIQNMLLTAHALGLGAIWRTGGAAYHEKVKEFFGLTPKGEMAGFIYIGYPDLTPKAVKKTDFEDYTVWMN
ncbi:nitroreductase family protein [Fictibacillus phosphorivorans]|uniref:nitroreductase family protein n=1 Tax=Fictibacillus phosphorivorans TaxID=1221500 RepID=UPI00203EA3C8|nr:nitroreductase [Fictibacillus phosphorivorans]MCM3718960.1 nitroreductase [Fictibacillus phosphorivorans]MCM3776582.1 nitroreductase [Fictibacillus phosphorivorans]